jgi:hypothetical protein
MLGFWENALRHFDNKSRQMGKEVGEGFKTIRREGLDNVSLFSPYLIAPVFL